MQLKPQHQVTHLRGGRTIPIDADGGQPAPPAQQNVRVRANTARAVSSSGEVAQELGNRPHDQTFGVLHNPRHARASRPNRAPTTNNETVKITTHNGLLSRPSNGPQSYQRPRSLVRSTSPSRCLVVIGLREGRLGAVQAVPWPLPWGQFEDEIVAALAGRARGCGDQEILLVAYDDRAPRRAAAIEQLDAVLTHLGLDVTDRLAVAPDGRWTRLDCRDPACCPPGGEPLPPVDQVPAIAEWVLRGVVPFADREAMVASIEPGPDRPLYDVPRPPAARPRAAAARRAWGLVLGTDGPPQPLDDLPIDQVRLAVAAAAVPKLRDGVLDVVCPGLLPGEDVVRLGRRRRMRDAGPSAGLRRAPYDILGEGAATEELLRRLTEFARRLPDYARADTLALTAACAWWHGRGTLSSICLDRALDLEPHHSLAVLVALLLAQGVDPRVGCA